jgi:hypothetical protein
VLVKVDERLTVEVRAVEPPEARKRSAADVFRERSNRQVPDLA